MNYSQATILSPIGDLIAIASPTHLVMLEFADSPGLEKKVSVIARLESAPPENGAAIQEASKDSSLGLDRVILRDDRNNKILSQTTTQLSEYFAGTRQIFDIPLAPIGTDFQVKAWIALQKIPYGETRSYKEEAILAGNPKAVRAIGGANNKNPIVILIPCHRVIGADGSLVGYGGGMTRKVWLLDHEQK